MKFLARKLESKERRIPVNGLKTIYRESKFEVEINEQVDYLWIGDQHIQNMEVLDATNELYELEVDDSYMEILLANIENDLS
jgi:hypothetical protein